MDFSSSFVWMWAGFVWLCMCLRHIYGFIFEGHRVNWTDKNLYLSGAYVSINNPISCIWKLGSREAGWFGQAHVLGTQTYCKIERRKCLETTRRERKSFNQESGWHQPLSCIKVRISVPLITAQDLSPFSAINWKIQFSRNFPRNRIYRERTQTNLLPLDNLSGFWFIIYNPSKASLEPLYNLTYNKNKGRKIS